MVALDAIVENVPAAKASIDIALHDLIGRASGLPVWAGGQSMAKAKKSAWPALLTTRALMVKAVEKRLADAGLPELSWYDVLWALEQAPSGQLRMHELASATVITGMVVLSYIAGGLGVLGLAFMAFGLFAPHVLHLH